MNRKKELKFYQKTFDLDFEAAGDYPFEGGNVLVRCYGKTAIVVSKTPKTIAELRKYFERFANLDKEIYELRKREEEIYRKYAESMEH